MKNDARGQFVALLHDLARQMQAMDDVEFEKILSGDLKIEIRVAGGSQEQKRRKKKTHSPEDTARLCNALRRTNTREQARELIDNALHTKDQLLELARALDIPVPKTVNMEHLKTRLVEATVGFRIRSAAVRGELETSYSPLEQVK